MPWDHAVAGFGVAAATLLVGGSIFLRYQRDRHHFLLMKAALERGMTAFPGVAPGWLISMRVGTLALVLGVGLLVSGIFAYQTAGSIEIPRVSELPPPPPATAPPPALAANAAPTPPPPPRPMPEMEQWHRVQNQKAAGLGLGGAGAIIALLGIVRIAFARLERQYTRESSSQT